MTGQPLARAVTDLWWAIEDEAHPESALRVRQVVFDALQDPKPRSALNLGLRHLKARNPTLRDLRRWLDSDAVGAAASRGGAHWALVEWRDALDAILCGVRPHVAFGMARRGRRHATGFSDCDNLAAYVEHRFRAGGRGRGLVAAIMKDVEGVMGNRTPDARTLRSARKKLSCVSDVDVKEMTDVHRGRYGLP